ncbi:hypothetical protein CHLRE_11g469150v5 [Chlamydomonas reinhardtii]|uniref:Uncharacterized protein n=1 Tax=Chlamydomonas reinhardtii TaxID=3055 RepID=A8JC54_CHLRE|nr:uncharacterized protein CHLRE_11g469150v5 [Chlamydomonas reinhardtii]PNW76733.1 hypothetical protein CHLRE_11g469150v5 [Chlamydomonas reinhardtii]|eukprot:XP_001699551.1 predicted protein [Chlamydomonas reinhardtii]
MKAAKDRAASSSSRAKSPVASELKGEAEDLKAKFLKIQAEVSSYKALSVVNQKLEDELTRLREENEAQAAKLAAQQGEVAAAVAAAQVEAVAPLQQQLEELSQQLQNSQVQLERLGEAVEAAEADKAAAVKQLQDENAQLLAALAGAASRLAELVYPAGTLPAGLSVTTRLEGSFSLEKALATAAAAATAPAAAPAVAAAEPVVKEAAAAAVPAGPQPLWRRPAGFLGWLIGVVAFWVYQVLGALLLYYAAAILRGAPPALNLEFGLGCLVVCTLLPLANRLLVVPRAA